MRTGWNFRRYLNSFSCSLENEKMEAVRGKMPCPKLHS